MPEELLPRAGLPRLSASARTSVERGTEARCPLERRVTGLEMANAGRAALLREDSGGKTRFSAFSAPPGAVALGSCLPPRITPTPCFHRHIYSSSCARFSLLQRPLGLCWVPSPHPCVIVWGTSCTLPLVRHQKCLWALPNVTRGPKSTPG